MHHIYIISFLQIFKDMQAETKFKVIHIQTLPAGKERNNTFEDGSSLWKEKDSKLYTYEATCKASTTYASFNNGFFGAFFQAYNNHEDVKITPDDVWITIMLHFSKYVNENAEQLRKAFVSHEGKQKLTVETSNEVLQTQWDDFFTLMIEAIKKNTNKGVIQRFESNFTTTGRVQKIISTAVIMNTCQKFFSYGRSMTLCGIQNVHLGGTLDDWKSVLAKTQSLVQFDLDGQLKRYVKNVSIILQQFIETYQGKVDLDFWNKIIHYQGSRGSGSTSRYSGWLIHFFGYEGTVEDVRMQSIDLNIEIDNKITGVVKDVQLVGGFKAISSEGNVHRPHLSMAIRDPPPPKQRRYQDYDY